MQSQNWKSNLFAYQPIPVLHNSVRLLYDTAGEQAPLNNKINNNIQSLAPLFSGGDINYVITSAIPASADAAALGKYGSIPVSPYTGVPNISIPLYTIKSGDLTLPISLSYHAGGIKVEEMASSVGLGWVLNAGGAITRTVRGLPDEAIYGFLDPNHYVPNILKRYNQDNSSTFTQAQANMYLNQIGMGTIDGEPDMYNFNFGGWNERHRNNNQYC